MVEESQGQKESNQKASDYLKKPWQYYQRNPAGHPEIMRSMTVDELKKEGLTFDDLLAALKNMGMTAKPGKTELEFPHPSIYTDKQTYLSVVGADNLGVAVRNGFSFNRSASYLTEAGRTNPA